MVAAGIVAGNSLGRRCRGSLDEEQQWQLQVGVLVGCTVLAVGGLA